jgi:hypothetical protein
MDSQLSARIQRLERSNRLQKGVTALFAGLLITLASVPQVSSKASNLSAYEFDLLGPNGKVTAKLTTLRNGPNLLFYDDNGKLVENVGIINDATLVGAGLGVTDGNAIISGTGVLRMSMGVSTKAPGGAGEGLSTYDASGRARSAFGQTTDGSIVYASAYDPDSNNSRVGWVFYPAIDFEGVYTHDQDGTTRSYFGQTTENDPTEVEAFWGLNYPGGGPAVNGYTPTAASPYTGMNVWDTAGNFRSVDGVGFFGVFDSSENLVASIPP